jgi:hypothetical protein
MSLTREELREELAAFPTRDELRRNYPSRSELRDVLDTLATKADQERFATKADLERFATKAELAEFRAETAQGFVDLHRYMEILIEDLKMWTKTLFDGTNARMEAMDRRLTAKDDEQDQRLDNLDRRTARLESRPRRPPK